MDTVTTDKEARTLAPLPNKDRMVRIAPAMYLRVKPSGARAYVQRLQHGGKDRWRVVGHPDSMKLAEAIALAHSRRASRGPAPSDTTLTCAAAVQLFMRQYIEREWKQTRNAKVYADWIEAELASTPLRLLSRDKVVRIVQDYSLRKTARAGRTGGRVSQNRLLAFAKLWLGWCVECGYIDHNPADALTPRVAGGKEQSRERVLGLNELKNLWALEGSHSPLLRALLLTGCRIRELQLARCGDLHVDPDAPEDGPLSLTIPAKHSKNGKEHRVPLTTPALMQMNLKGKPQDPLFPDSSTSASAVQAWLKRWHTREGTEPWTPHDLRRTFATLLAGDDLQVPIETIQRCLNHTLDGPIGRYVRSDHYALRREAHEKLAAWVNQNVAAPVEFGGKA